MKAIRMNSIVKIGILTLFLNLIACDSNKNVKETEVSQIETIQQESLEISNVEVSLVELDYRMKANDTAYSQAWLIQLEIPNFPKYSGSKVDFYVGDYKVPEYGETEDGIYFRVFEKDKLERMNAAEIRYKYGSSQEIMTSKQRLVLPALDKLEIQNEKDKLMRKN